MELKQLLGVLERHHRWIIAATVLAGLAAFLISSFLPPTYEAQAYLTILRSGLAVSFDDKIKTISELDAIQTSIDQATRRKTLTTLTQSPEIAAKVAEQLGDQLTPPLRDPFALQRSIQVVNESDLIRITAKAGTPGQAARLANIWAQIAADRINQIYGNAPISPASLRMQAEAAKRDYDQKQAQLVAFLADNPIERLTREITQVQQKIDDHIALENKLDRLLSDAQALRQRMSSDAASNTRGDELAALLLEASAFSTWANLPVNLQIPIDQLSTGTLTEQLSTLDTLIATLQARKQVLEAEGIEQSVAQINRLQAELEAAKSQQAQLTQARDLAWTTYTSLANQVAEVSVSAQTQGRVVRLAASAMPPNSPVSPNRWLYTLLASIVALMASSGLAFAVEYWRHRVGTEEEIETLLGVSPMAAIPNLPRAELPDAMSNGRARFPVEQPSSLAAEAFNLLRYSLQANGESNAAWLIASALPFEGKSTIVANLAVLSAQLGKRVILVDADFRHPVQHEWFGLKNGKGLAEFLMQESAKVDDYLQQSSIENLYILVAGQIPAQPAALLESARLKELMSQLKARAELVLIDSPAVLGLVDALLLARVADKIVLLIERDRLTTADVVRTKEALLATGTPLAGVVLNRATRLPGAPTYQWYSVGAPEDTQRRASGEDGRQVAQAHRRDGSATRPYSSRHGWQDMRERMMRLLRPNE